MKLKKIICRILDAVSFICFLYGLSILTRTYGDNPTTTKIIYLMTIAFIIQLLMEKFKKRILKIKDE